MVGNDLTHTFRNGHEHLIGFITKTFFLDMTTISYVLIVLFHGIKLYLDLNFCMVEDLEGDTGVFGIRLHSFQLYKLWVSTVTPQASDPL